MGCNTLEYQGKEYTREELAQLIRDGKLVVPESKDEIDTSQTHDFKTMPFRFSMDKIMAGKKFITVRPYSYSMGTYKTNKGLFNVYPQGKMHIKDFLAQNKMTRADFIKDFIGEEEVKYHHIQQFLNDDKPMFVYRIERVIDKDDIIPEIDDPRFLKIYQNRQAIIKKLKSQLRSEKDPVKQEELRARLETAREQSKSLLSDDERTFGALFNMMKNDIATAKRILDTKTDERSINYAKSLTNSYVESLTKDFSDILNSLTGPIKEEILDFISDATDLAERLNKHFLSMANATQMRLTGKDQLKLDGMPVDATDTNIATGWVYDTRWNKNPTVQALTKIIRDAQVTHNLTMVSFREVNNKLVHNLKKVTGNKNTFDYMVQTDDKGKKTGMFVSRESAAYREARRESSKDVTDQMVFYAQNHNFKVNSAAAKQRHDFLVDYYTNNNNITLSTDEAERGKTLEDKVAQYAHALALQKDPLVMQRILERAAQNPNRITRDDKLFFSRFLEYGGFRAELMGDKYVHPLEMTAHDKWVDPKYTAIQALPKEDARRAFYDHWTEHIEKGRRMRRDENQYLPWNFIPEKYKPLGIGNKFKQIAHDHLAQRISKNKGDINPETGEVEKKIPLYMLNDSLSPENKSYDLGNVLEDFVKENSNYEEKSKVEEPANMLLSMIKQQPVYDTNSDGSIKMIGGKEQYKQGLSNNYIQAAHRVAASIYGELQDQEFSTGMKIYTADEKAQMKQLRLDIDGLGLTADEKKIALQYTAIGSDYDGNNDKIAKYVQMARKYQNLRDNAHVFTGSKAANSLMFFTSVKYLGLNLFAGMGEILQGYSTLFTESAGGRYFNDSQAARAMGTVLKGLTPWHSEAKEEISSIARFFDTVGDIFHESEGRVKSKTESWSFAQYRAANYMTNTSFTIAMLMHDKITDKEGTERSLYDSMQFKDGKASWLYNIDEPLYNTDGKPSDFLLGLMHKSDEILALNRERKTFMDPIKVDAKMVGRMLGQFKKNWMIGMFYNRFGAEREGNLTGGQSFKGFYRSFWDEITKLPKVTDPITGEQKTDTSLRALLGIPVNLAKYLIKFSFIGKKLGMLEPGEYSELEQANLKKFMRELSMAMTIWTTMLVLSSMNGGDDKDWLRTYFINQLARLQRDVSTFMSPTEFSSFVKNPAPVISSVTDYFSISDSIIKSTVLGDPFTSNGDLRFLKSVEKQTPYINQIHNMKNKFDQAILYGSHY